MSSRADSPDTDEVVSEPGKESLAISRPGEGNTFRVGSLRASVNLGFKLINNRPKDIHRKNISILQYWEKTYLLSRSKIFTQLEVAAHNQYRLGEKTRALTMSPASRLYRCLPSLRSQSMVIPSLPPDAASEPSGETATVLIYPVWP